jgi:metal-sulfur cluster biosynthetic enzyme
MLFKNTMETADATTMPSEDAVRQALRNVIDPEVGMNVVDLGLVYEIVVAAGRVRINLTMTTPACPMSSLIVEDAYREIHSITPPSADIDILLVWEPPWDSSMLSEQAKEHFGW